MSKKISPEEFKKQHGITLEEFHEMDDLYMQGLRDGIIQHITQDYTVKPWEMEQKN